MIPMEEIVTAKVSTEPNGNTLNVEGLNDEKENGCSKGSSRRSSGSEPG